MRIYKCIISGDEMFTDANRRCTEGGFYRLTGKVLPENGEVDIVMDNRLCKTSFANKKEYLSHWKSYMNDLMDALALKKFSKEDIELKKIELQMCIKTVMEKYNTLEFYTGESMRQDAMTPCLEWEKDENGDKIPVMYFYRAGLEEEAV